MPAVQPAPMDCAILGQHAGTHIGGSLVRAARRLGIEPVVLDAAEAESRNRYVRAWNWRVRGRRPGQLERYARSIPGRLGSARPLVLVATGAAPLTAATLAVLRERRIISVNYSTDDPFNAVHRAPWHLEALPRYDIVFTPRRANVEDLQRLGCALVHYLPFAFDPDTVGAAASSPPGPTQSEIDVLFVGGADSDRFSFVREYMKHGPPPVLAGGYWDRDPLTRPFSVGLKSPSELTRLTRAAKVNVCLVRRANRDGHVMRSFEIPAIGGFMVAEDTAEHRELFGEEGAAVLYFATPADVARHVRWAIENPVERRRMADAAQRIVADGHHAYHDRLRAMLGAARTLAEQRGWVR